VLKLSAELTASCNRPEWGTVNPVSGLARISCWDSVADASGAGARQGRFRGTQCSDTACNSEPCARVACNVGEVYTVECPAHCSALPDKLGGAVIGSGADDNPFMDLSSICRAAIAAGVSNDDETSIVSFKIVEPVRSYRGDPQTARRGIPTLDYANAQPIKGGSGFWYGVRAFVFVPAGQAIQVAQAPAPGGDQLGHMALRGSGDVSGALTKAAAAPTAATPPEAARLAAEAAPPATAARAETPGAPSPTTLAASDDVSGGVTVTPVSIVSEG